MTICKTCKYWHENGGIDCSNDEDVFGNPLMSCPCYEKFKIEEE